jgi:Putative MetA-pathway of phenol degradation
VASFNHRTAGLSTGFKATGRGCLVAAMLAATSARVTAQGVPRRAASSTKSAYTLFHPTPADRMRELSTDRPDQTETPFTVDAGHVQVEMDLVNVVRDVEGFSRMHTTTTAWQIAPFNVKLGLLNNVDLHVVLNTHQWSRVEDEMSGTIDTPSGLGDVATRLKVNLWGNDDGRTALAVIPFVKWPLAASGVRNGRFEGGIIFPFAAEFSGGWDLGAMTEVDAVAADADGHHLEFVNTITVGHDVAPRMGMYVELVLTSGSASGFWNRWQADVGLTYGLGSNVQFDAGCNFGINEPAPDVNPFVGLSVRF